MTFSMPPPKIIKRLPKILVSVASQLGWSGANFIVVILLVRQIEASEFGMFAIYLAIKRLMVMAAGALVLVPLTVISAGKPTRERCNHQRAISNTVLIFFAVLFMISLLIEKFVGWHITEIVVFIAGGVALEIHRRIDYIEMHLYVDFIGAIYNLFGIIMCLLLLLQMGHIKLCDVVLMMGIINLTWVIISKIRYGLSLDTANLSELKKIWSIGGWGLGSNMATYLYSQISTFYTFFIIGSTGVAVLELGRQFIAVVQPMIFGMANYFQPRLAISAKKDTKSEFSKKLWDLTIIQLIFSAVVLLAVLLASPFLLQVVVPDKLEIYQSVLPVAYIFAFAALLQIGWQQPGFAVIALGKPMYGFITKVVGAMIALPIGYMLTLQYGVTGAAMSKAVGDGLIIIISIYMLMRVQR